MLLIGLFRKRVAKREITESAARIARIIAVYSRTRSEDEKR